MYLQIIAVYHFGISIMYLQFQENITISFIFIYTDDEELLITRCDSIIITVLFIGVFTNRNLIRTDRLEHVED